MTLHDYLVILACASCEMYIGDDIVSCESCSNPQVTYNPKWRCIERNDLCSCVKCRIKLIEERLLNK